MVALLELEHQRGSGCSTPEGRALFLALFSTVVSLLFFFLVLRV